MSLQKKKKCLTIQQKFKQDRCNREKWEANGRQMHQSL